MDRVTICPICKSKKTKNIHNYLFKYPGMKTIDQLTDITIERLWILFEHILKRYDDISFKSVFCNNCGFIFTNPRFSEDELSIKYQIIEKIDSVKTRFQQKPAPGVASRSKRIYNLVNSFIAPEPEKRPAILDYGGASGYNLIPFINQYDCYLIDYEKWQLPDGVTYLGKNHTVLDKDKRFDAILLLHVLEHVPDPVVLLDSLSGYLNENGIIYVEVPLGCFREWKNLSEPLTHINFFSEESILNCFKKCELNANYLSTSFQHLIYEKTWCINAIGKKNIHTTQQFSPMSTVKQMKSLKYYLPYTYNIKAIKNAFIKTFKIKQ